MKWIKIIQIAVAVLMMLAILLQSRGAGIGSIFGGSGGVYRAKRGIERVLFISTIVLAVMFFISAIIGLFLSVKS